jgi:hypothetical protein
MNIPAFEGAEMRKQCIVVAAAVMIAFLSVFGAAAQGPQGAGAEKAAQSTDAPRSYNPIKWVKKGPNATTEKPKKGKNKKPSEKSATPDTSVPPNAR